MSPGHVRYNSYRSYLTKKFKKPVLKIPLNGGFSCPNRDGTISTRGCSFCDNASFSPTIGKTTSHVQQLRETILKASSRFDLFIPYFQPFSNTYGEVDELAEIYESVIGLPGVVGLAIGTRPDCFSQEIYEYLSDVNRRIYLSVELGLQSVSDETLKRNGRGHTFSDFEKAVAELSGRGIESVAHMMIGLPGDTLGDVIAGAKRLAGMPVRGVKLHQLMIIKGTLMEQWYLNGEVAAVEIDEYKKIVGEFLSYLRPDQHIHRIVADSTVERGLIAPLWSAEKMRSLDIINRHLEEKDIFQGCKYNI